MNGDAIRQPNRARRPRLSDELALEDMTISVFIDVLEALDSPHGLSQAIRMRYGDFSGVVNAELDPMHFNDSQAFADAYLSVKLMSKYFYFDIGIDRVAVALEGFLAAERACLETNKRFRMLREGSDPKGQNPAVQAVISIAVRKISHILGEVDLDRIAKQFGWGPGASIGVRGLHTSAYNKFSGPLDVTRNCLAMGLACINSVPSWVNAVVKTDEYPSIPVSALPGALKIVTGSEIIFVPKNAKTDRVIAIEPSLNGFIQKGVGGYIRKRLRERAGVDLNDQSINQSLAQYGSRTGELATVDLSMASDTIAKELVRELLPEEWFALLSTSRCEQGTIKATGETVWFQKFSSMGNAYTFELESLIFFALSQACVDQLKGEQPEQLHAVSVYGDDLVVPCYAVPLLLEVLDFCGFKANKSKTYSFGPFRESCGKDFFHGTSVRPVFIKDRISTVESAFKVANSLRRYANSRNALFGCDERLLEPWSRIVSRIPRRFRYFISEGYGDVGLISNFDEASPPRARNGWEGFVSRALFRVPYRTAYKETQFGYTTTLFLARGVRETVKYAWVNDDSRRIEATLYKDGGDVQAQGQYTPRDRTLPKIGQLWIRDWYNLGPWTL
jgi:hypothetical protein